MLVCTLLFNPSYSSIFKSRRKGELSALRYTVCIVEGKKTEEKAILAVIQL